MLCYPSDADGKEELFRWCEEILGDIVKRDDSYAFAVVNKNSGKIEAGIIYYWYDGANIFISTAIKTSRLITPEIIMDVLWIAFKHPFNCNRISALVAETNMRSQRLVEKFGFQQEGIMRDHPVVGKNMLLYGLTRHDFMEGPYEFSKWRRRKILN